MKTSSSDLVDQLAPTMDQVDARKKRVSLLTWSSEIMAAFLLLLLLAFFLDYSLSWTSSVIRWAVPGGCGIIIAWLTFRGMSAICQTQPSERSAREIDQAYPELEERWSTVVNLTKSKDPAPIKGSSELLDQVAAETVDYADRIAADQVIQKKSLYLPLTLAATGLVVLALFTIQSTSIVKTLAQRFFLPWQDASLTQIQQSEPSKPIPRGSSYDISATVSGKIPRKAELIIRWENEGAEESHRFSLSPDPAFTHRLKNIKQSLQYQIRSGDKITTWQSITVVDHPELITPSIVIRPPDYTKQAPLKKGALPFKIRSVEGSQFSFTFTSNQPLTEAFLLQETKDKKLARIPLQQDNETSYRFESKLMQSFIFRPILINAAGLENLHQPKCQVTIFKDRAPSVRLLSSTESAALNLEDTLSVDFAAKDDFGIERANLRVTIEREGQEPEITNIPIDLGENQGEKNFQHSVDLPLAQLELDSKAKLSYSVEVEDSRKLHEMGSKLVENLPKQPSDPNNSRSSKSSEQPKAAQNLRTAETNPEESKEANDARIAATDPKSKPSGENEPSPDPNSRQAEATNTPQSKESSNDKKADDEQKKKIAQGQAAESEKKELALTPSEIPLAKIETNVPQAENNLEKRFIDIRSDIDGTANSKEKVVEFENLTAIEERERLEKETILLEGKLANFERKLAQAQANLKPPLEAKLKKNQALDHNEINQLKTVKNLLEKAVTIASNMEEKTRRTPFHFAGLQINEIAKSNLVPAQDSSAKSIDSQTPLAQLRVTHGHLVTAQNQLQTLRSQYDNVKAARERAVLTAEVKDMFLLYLEGMPLLLGDDRESPYTRNFLEMTKKQAKAYQRHLDHLVRVKQKMAELLKDHPELRARMMSKKRDQTKNFRDLLRNYHSEQQQLQQLALTLSKPDAPKDLVYKNLVAHFNKTHAQLLKHADRVKSWLPFQTETKNPDLQNLLTNTASLAAQGEQILQDISQQDPEIIFPQLQEMATSASTSLQLLATLEEDMILLDDHYLALRRSELHELIKQLHQAKNHFTLSTQNDYAPILSDQQRTLMLKTLELASGIELNAAPFLKESEQIKTTHDELQLIISNKIIEVQEELLTLLQEEKLKETSPYFLRCHSGYRDALIHLDRLVYQIIDHIDQLPEEEPHAGGNQEKPIPPNLEEEALAELMALLERESDYRSSFGIPHCRPTNAMILSDWEKQMDQKPKDQDNNRPEKGKEAEKANKGEKGKKGQKSEKGKKGDKSGKGSPGERARKQARALAREAQQAQAQANQQAQALSLSPPVGGTAAELQRLARAQSKRQKWNKLPTELKEQLLQQRGQNPPKEYEKAIQDYFRAIADTEDHE